MERVVPRRELAMRRRLSAFGFAVVFRETNPHLNVFGGHSPSPKHLRSKQTPAVLRFCLAYTPL